MEITTFILQIIGVYLYIALCGLCPLAIIHLCTQKPDRISKPPLKPSDLVDIKVFEELIIEANKVQNTLRKWK